MPSKPDDRVLLTEYEVAYFTGISVHTLRSARSNKPNLRVPPAVWIEGFVFYDLDAVLDWVCSEAAKASGAPGKARGIPA